MHVKDWVHKKTPHSNFDNTNWKVKYFQWWLECVQCIQMRKYIFSKTKHSHPWFIFSIIWLIDWSVKCFALSDQQPIIQRYSTYNHRRPRKTANIHVWVAVTSESFGIFASKNFWADYQNCCQLIFCKITVWVTGASSKLFRSCIQAYMVWFSEDKIVSRVFLLEYAQSHTSIHTCLSVVVRALSECQSSASWDQWSTCWPPPHWRLQRHKERFRSYFCSFVHYFLWDVTTTKSDGGQKHKQSDHHTGESQGEPTGRSPEMTLRHAQ